MLRNSYRDKFHNSFGSDRVDMEKIVDDYELTDSTVDDYEYIANRQFEPYTPHTPQSQSRQE